MGNRTYHPRGQLIEGYRCRKHPLYTAWATMLSRCYDDRQTSFTDYGGRGIRVCDRWHHFRYFVADMGARPFLGATLERLANDQDYGPDNCVWATRTQQCFNRRRFKNNTTGATGIHRGQGENFVARITVDGRRVYVGAYKTIEEARDARTRAIEARA